MTTCETFRCAQCNENRSGEPADRRIFGPVCGRCEQVAELRAVRRELDYQTEIARGDDN